MASDEVADDEKRVMSEDANAGLATPIMDLTAAVVIALIAIFMAVESLRLPVPGGVIFTAPGLLPFLTSASLLVMALLLGYSAITRRRITPRALDRFEIPADAMRSLTLGGIVVALCAGAAGRAVRDELQYRLAAFLSSAPSSRCRSSS